MKIEVIEVTLEALNDYKNWIKDFKSTEADVNKIEEIENAITFFEKRRHKIWQDPKFITK